MRLLFCAICLLCLTFSTNAQVSIGVSGGANMTFWKWHIKPLNTDLGYKPDVGWRTAAVADWRLTPIIGLRVEISYQTWQNRIEMTFVEDFPPQGGGLTGYFRGNYHNLAGSLLLRITPFRSQKLYILAGTSTASITGAWGRYSKEIRFFPSEKRKKIDLENFNRTQYFADFGAGMRFPVGKGSLITEVRYLAGLSNLAGVPTVDARISTLGLNVGYLVQL